MPSYATRAFLDSKYTHILLVTRESRGLILHVSRRVLREKETLPENLYLSAHRMQMDPVHLK